ncbi:TPA: molecular chaperone [Klebsiella aerogenes]|nr:molecular chaperone [Klebsiella aerogenes]
MRKIRYCLLFVCAGLLPVMAQAAGLSIGGTRLVFDAASGEADIQVRNSNKDEPILVQSWVDDFGDKNKAPFIVTPPLFRLEAGDANDLRVVQTGGTLPADRESLFLLNIKSIPTSGDAESANILQFAIKNQIKLIYRPADLPGSSREAEKNLHWSRTGNQLQVNNDSPYYVTVTKITLNGQTVKTTFTSSVIPPHGSQHYPASVSPGAHVNWTALDDFGSADNFTAALSS